MDKENFINEQRPHESGIKHVSGRAYYTDDISEPPGTLYGAIGWSKKAHAIIKKIKIAYGGMASIPKRAIYCERVLLNSSITKDVIEKAKKALEKDFLPISDMRASGGYRKIIAKNLLEKCFLEINEKKLIGVYG